jgi:hypothetical protein
MIFETRIARAEHLRLQAEQVEEGWIGSVYDEQQSIWPYRSSAIHPSAREAEFDAETGASALLKRPLGPVVWRTQ